MTPELYKQVGRIYHEALELATEDRSAFLDQACGGNEELQREVERLLASHEQLGNFLAEPAVAAAAELLVEEKKPSFIGRLLGHYQILSPIGAGGMGEVFLAQDLRLERRVALKLLPPEFTTNRDRVRRFEQEAKAASALNHPNIVTIHEIGQVKTEAGDLHFIAEEFIEGQTLRHQIKEGKLSLLDALDIAAQAANALQASHAANIVHRDIKPENIMLRPDGFIKILDFGLAKLTEPRAPQPDFDSESPTCIYNKTVPGAILGTVSYMSPEQTRGLEVDARSDLWSLGVVLYEMLTGQAPFEGKTATDVIVSIIQREPPPLANSLAQTPPELERIVGKAMVKNREERYQTARDLAIDLKRLKHQLEFEADLARLPKPAPPSPAAEPRVTTESAPSPVSLPGSQAETARKPSIHRPLLAGVALLVVAIASLAAWLSFRPKATVPVSPPAPERLISFSLTVQKMRGGQEYQAPFEASGQEIFESGYKFRLNLVSPQAGWLYLLNEGPTAGGAISYVMVFPIPSLNGGSAQLAAGQAIQTGWYLFTEHEGTEKFWLVWAAQSVAELEAVKGMVNPRDKGAISDPHQLNAVRALLNQHAQAAPEAVKDKVKEQTNVRGRGETLIHLVELKHR